MYTQKISQAIEAVGDIAKAYEQADKGLMESAVLKIHHGWEETEQIRRGIYRRVADDRLFFSVPGGIYLHGSTG